MATVTHTPHTWISERKQSGPQTIRHSHLNPHGRFAVFVTTKFGSMAAFYFMVIWIGGWIVLATVGIGFFKQDPYPFTLLLIISNLIQLLAMPILAVGQQILNKASDKQAEQSFKDAETIMELQDDIHRLLKTNNQLTEDIHASIVKK